VDADRPALGGGVTHQRVIARRANVIGGQDAVVKQSMASAKEMLVADAPRA
jgi:hypothetical protein